MDKKKSDYDRARQLEELGRLLARFERDPFSAESYHRSRHATRVKHIWMRLFLVLWELPAKLQTELCGTLARRTLPAFERRHPTLTSMRNFLSPDWMRESIGCSGAGERARWEQLGYELNDLRQELDEQSPMGGDELLYSTACELWDSLEPDAAPVAVTYACIHSAVLAIKAEQYEAWELLDPEAAEYVRDVLARVKREGSVPMPEGFKQWRVPEADPAAQARWFAGWEAAMTWLRSAHLEAYDKVKDRAGLAVAVRRVRAGKTRSTLEKKEPT